MDDGEMSRARKAGWKLCSRTIAGCSARVLKRLRTMMDKEVVPGSPPSARRHSWLTLPCRGVGCEQGVRPGRRDTRAVPVRAQPGWHAFYDQDAPKAERRAARSTTCWSPRRCWCRASITVPSLVMSRRSDPATAKSRWPGTRRSEASPQPDGFDVPRASSIETLPLLIGTRCARASPRRGVNDAPPGLLEIDAPPQCESSASPLYSGHDHRRSRHVHAQAQARNAVRREALPAGRRRSDASRHFINGRNLKDPIRRVSRRRCSGSLLLGRRAQVLELARHPYYGVGYAPATPESDL